MVDGELESTYESATGVKVKELLGAVVVGVGLGVLVLIGVVEAGGSMVVELDVGEPVGVREGVAVFVGVVIDVGVDVTVGCIPE